MLEGMTRAWGFYAAIPTTAVLNSSTRARQVAARPPVQRFGKLDPSFWGVHEGEARAQTSPVEVVRRSGAGWSWAWPARSKPPCVQKDAA